MSPEFALWIVATFWIGFGVGCVIGYVTGRKPQRRDARGRFVR